MKYSVIKTIVFTLAFVMGLSLAAVKASTWTVDTPTEAVNVELPDLSGSMDFGTSPTSAVAKAALPSWDIRNPRTGNYERPTRPANSRLPRPDPGPLI